MKFYLIIMFSKLTKTSLKLRPEQAQNYELPLFTA